ncbi:MAG TPA: hypothetical protein EYO33_26505 [Phycisphaerales bacterium]|nr:hypothetical protein [Phycisphaerales bacterium]
MSLIKPLGNLFSPKSPQKAFAVKESWNVNGQQFDSSQDLLDSGRDYKMENATYTRTELRSKTLGERVWGAGSKAILGGALATGLNAGLAIATGGASIGVVSAAILLGGTLLGAASGIGGNPQAECDGVLNTDGDRTHFYVDNKADRRVELNGTDNSGLLQTNFSGNTVS